MSRGCRIHCEQGPTSLFEIHTNSVLPSIERAIKREPQHAQPFSCDEIAPNLVT
jgi:hypothetical protein